MPSGWAWEGRQANWADRELSIHTRSYSQLGKKVEDTALQSICLFREAKGGWTEGKGVAVGLICLESKPSVLAGLPLTDRLPASSRLPLVKNPLFGLIGAPPSFQ